jgi:hypothetical protein
MRRVSRNYEGANANLNSIKRIESAAACGKRHNVFLHSLWNKSIQPGVLYVSASEYLAAPKLMCSERSHE